MHPSPSSEEKGRVCASPSDAASSADTRHTHNRDDGDDRGTASQLREGAFPPRPAGHRQRDQDGWLEQVCEWAQAAGLPVDERRHTIEAAACMGRADRPSFVAALEQWTDWRDPSHGPGVDVEPHDVDVEPHDVPDQLELWP
jgi:hypothetical protein